MKTPKSENRQNEENIFDKVLSSIFRFVLERMIMSISNEWKCTCWKTEKAFLATVWGIWRDERFGFECRIEKFLR